MAPLTHIEFLKIKDLLLKKCGLALSMDQQYLVETRLSELGYELGVATFGDIHDKLVSDGSKLWSRVIDLMTTNETFWFRDDSCWNTLIRKIFPQLFQLLDHGMSHIRIWSAACSTGQECYSLAILIDELCQHLNRFNDFDRFSIVATDISQSALEAAKKGYYDDFNMKRGLSSQRKETYFVKTRNGWQIKEHIQERIQFHQLNLMDSFRELGVFHMVLCRNVAIYFSQEFREDLFNRIEVNLSKNGYLLLGATESIRGYSNAFQMVEFEKGVYYQLIPS